MREGPLIIGSFQYLVVGRTLTSLDGLYTTAYVSLPLLSPCKPQDNVSLGGEYLIPCIGV